ncbi:Clp protease ClpP [Chitinivorax sp. B]|uniref:Clp protease ClpP n=1 Tax=Chitinivorax sp. B TaxID=2502235 RepID=UPI0020173CA2|nr:Clp protease ClpP [Chitinivorax sp. B]
MTGPDEGTAVEEQLVVPYVRYENQAIVRQISYYLLDEILPPIHYTELFNTLRNATENDLIYLHLNTPGGDFDTGLQLINNMHLSKACVTTVLEAKAYSMGALIFLAGDEIAVHDNCQLMFHNYSSSFIGKGNEQHAQVMAVGKWFEKVMHRVCEPFLTSEEIVAILKGEDIWMDSDEIRKRLQKMQASRPNKQDSSAIRRKADKLDGVSGT